MPTFDSRACRALLPLCLLFAAATFACAATDNVAPTNADDDHVDPSGDAGDAAPPPSDDFWNDEPCEDVFNVGIVSTPPGSGLQLSRFSGAKLVASYLDSGMVNVAFPSIDGTTWAPASRPALGTSTTGSHSNVVVAPSSDALALAFDDRQSLGGGRVRNDAFFAVVTSGGEVVKGATSLAPFETAAGLAWDGQRFVALSLGADYALHLSTFSNTGVTGSSAVPLLGPQPQGGTGVAMASREGRTIFAIRGDAARIALRSYDGFSASDLGEVNGVGVNPQALSIAAHPEGGYLLAWESYAAPTTAYLTQRLDESGAPVGTPTSIFAITDASEAFRDFGPLAATSSGYASVWVEERPEAGASLVLHLARFDRNGAPLGERVIDTKSADISARVQQVFVEGKRVVAVLTASQRAGSAGVATRAHAAILCPRTR